MSNTAESFHPHHFAAIVAELLMSGQQVRFPAPGKSMQPTIRDGEVVTVEPLSPSDVRKGDIILYRRGEGLIAHRVIRIMKGPGTARSSAIASYGMFVLRGDASTACDLPVEPGQVLGRVVAVERQGRSISLVGRWSRMRFVAGQATAHAKRTLRDRF
jgi:signal peptidase I